VGGLFGLFKWILILSALLIAYQQIESVITLFPEKVLLESELYPLLSEIAAFLFDWIFTNNNLMESQLI